MLYYPPDNEALKALPWLIGSDDSWADRAGDLYEAAGGKLRRKDDSTPAEDATT